MPVITTDSTFGALSEGPLIARGAFGVVRLCHSSARGMLAVKFIPLPTDEAWGAAQREARALQLAAGPHTVELLGLIRLEPSPQRPVPLCLLLMNYLSGGTLASLASNWRPSAGRGLPTGLLRRFTRKIVEAVAHVHALGMAHRDIKGANLLLAPDAQSVKLADFGSCKLPAEAEEGGGAASPGFQGGGGGGAGGGGGGFGSSSGSSSSSSSSSGSGAARPVTAITARGVQAARGGGGGGGGGAGGGGAPAASPAPSSPRGEVGTIAWMAPEVVKRGLGDGTAGGAPAASASPSPTSLAFWQAADIWGLGATVLELLTGRPPWHGEAEEASEIMLCIASTDLRDKLPAWAGAEVTGFLRACLHPDPAARPPAADLLFTPFLFGTDCQDEEEGLGDSAAAALAAAPQPQRGRAASRAASPAAAAARPRAAKGAPAATPAALGALLHRLGSLPASAMAGALASCDSLKSEVRLSCRQVQHWFTGLHSRAGDSPSTDWVAQCLFTEERVPLGEYAEGMAAAAASYGPACTALVRAACAATSPACMHRECAASILFGASADAAWTFRVEAALLLGALAALPPPAQGEARDCGALAFVLHLVEARLHCWEHAGVPLASECTPLDERVALGFLEEESRAAAGGGGGGGESVARTTLGGIAVAMQWLATARYRLAARAQAAEAARKEAEDEVEEEEEGAWAVGKGDAAAAAAAAAAEEAQQPVGITVPDFAVLFYTRVNVWISELSTVLRALSACSEWWGSATASASARELAEHDVHALAALHQQLSRKAYSRLVAVRRCWHYAKDAVGFSASSPRKS